MGLRETAQKLAQSGMKAAGNVPASCNYEHPVSGTSYDASSGAVTKNTTQHMTSMVFGSYKQSEVDGQHIKPTDVKGLCAQLDLDVEPAMNGYVWKMEAGATAVYDIKDISQDPAGATWNIQLRKR